MNSLHSGPVSQGNIASGAAPVLTLRATQAEMQGYSSLLGSVPLYLRRGQDLLHWWREIERAGGPPVRFPLERSSNRATRSFGFYGEAPVEGRMLPVMGNVQEMFYDQIRLPGNQNLRSAQWMAEQMREFVLKYWMRISSFRQPEAYVDASQPVPPPSLARLSWCTAPRSNQVGFGFSQLFYRAVSGEIRPFPSYDRAAIVDQRELGRLYEWLLLKVRVFDFAVRIRPFGDNGPEVVSTLNEESHLVVHRDFVNDNPNPGPGILGDFGIGYSFIKDPGPGLFAFGPGQFEAAIELINFRVYETGYVSVRMIFVSNRPSGVMNLEIKPVSIGFWLADTLSLGFASQFLRPARTILEKLPFNFAVDPVLGYVNFVNAISGGNAAEILCVSLQQLERAFLIQHFKQHYQAVLGSLSTWRRFPDWLDASTLPSWVISGTGS